jgi:hypothetical protein
MRLANCLRANRPKVRAATAGPKTSPTIAIRLLANKTGQKLGHAKMMMAATLSTASAKTIAPRLARVPSIAAPIGVWNTSPSRPLIVVTTPTWDWLQCCWVTRNTLR